MNKTPIEWADYSSNPIRAENPATGHRGHYCEKVSPGCHRCYASTQNGAGHYPMSSTGVAYPAYPPGTKLPVPEARGRLEHYLNTNELRKWLNPNLKGKTIFPCDMTDLFGAWVSDEWLDIIFAYMALSSATFLVLTKRIERMREYVCRFGRKGCVEAAAADVVWQPWGFSWPLPNVWLGVSVENQHWTSRLHVLKTIPAAVTFASLEPLLGPIIIPPEAMPGWVIAGGESAGPPKRALVERCTDAKFAPCPEWCAGGCAGTGWRPKPEALAWVRSLRAQCVAAGVPFFFKNWGGPRPKSGGRLLDGRTWDQFPEVRA